MAAIRSASIPPKSPPSSSREHLTALLRLTPQTARIVWAGRYMLDSTPLMMRALSILLLGVTLLQSAALRGYAASIDLAADTDSFQTDNSDLLRCIPSVPLAMPSVFFVPRPDLDYLIVSEGAEKGWTPTLSRTESTRSPPSVPTV